MLGSHRDNAHFSLAGWKKRVILPCWILQILILLSVMGLFSYRLSRTITTWEEEDKKGMVPVVEFIWEAANIGFSLVSLVVTFIAIARFIAEVLTPLPLLFGCILNVVLSAAVLALDIVIYVQRKDKQYSLIGLALDAALIVVTLIPLIYAIVIYRRLLDYDDYHLPGNHKAFGFNLPEEGVEDRSSIQLKAPTPYDPTNSTLGPIATISSGEPQTRGRSVSIGSRRISLSFSRTQSRSPPPPPPVDAAMERRVSYDHKRDTQFEDYYQSRRSSLTQSRHRRSSSFNDISPQHDAKRALSNEYGFGDSPSPGEPNLGRTNASGEQVISFGTVPAGHVSRPRGNTVGRQVSYEAIVGGMNGSSPSVTITTPPEETEEVLRGHVLNSVPEIHDEEPHHHTSHTSGRATRKRASSESRQALLDDSDEENQGGPKGSARMRRDVEGLEDVELGNRTARRDS
ncbi:hypothetical protein F4808DRAFT_331769 [Astrocystis sublimbata]|nr:hypothetical protein F4808DRAFT_331769 [Astrocystis sublimbata]